MIKKIFYALSLASVWMLTWSCVGDRGSDPVTPRSGDAEVILRLKTPGDFSTPQSRALTHADENTLSDVYVLVFDKDNELTAIKEGLSVDYTPGTTSGEDGETYSGTGSFSVTLAPSSSTDEKYKLVVLANASAVLTAAIGTDVSTISDKTYSAVMAAIWGEITGKMFTASGSTIPMWGETGALVIEPGNSSQTLTLTRSVARIDVGVGVVSGTPSDTSWDGLDGDGAEIPFELEEVYVMRPNNRYAVAHTTAIDTPTIPADTEAFSAEDSKTIFKFETTEIPDTPRHTTREIYIPESDVIKGGTPGDANHKERMAIVVGGKYNNSTTTTYYRLDFADGDGDLMNVLRNHLYRFSISGVSGPGFPNVIEAYESLSMNMTVNILEWDMTDMGNIVFNDQNYLSVSPGELEFSRLEQTGTFTVMTDVAEGWEVAEDATTTVGGTTTVDWITNIDGEFSGINTRDAVTFTVAQNTTGAARFAYIKVSAGRLEFNVKVTQGITIPLQITITDLSGNALSSLNFAADNGTPGTAPDAQAFKVTWSPAEMDVTIVRTQTGVEPFTWQDATNEDTELLGGTGTFPFSNINPTAITTGLPFANRGSILTFTVTDGTNTAVKSIQLFQGQALMNVDNSFEVALLNPAAIAYTGGTATINVTSSATATGVSDTAIPWIAEFSTDGGTTWTTTAPSWLTFPASGTGSFEAEPQSAIVQSQPVTTSANIENTILRAAAPLGTSAEPYDLSTKGGTTAVNTANCYVLNAAGVYKLPLVYGNAIKDGADNPNAYTGSGPGGDDTILGAFPNHAGTDITSPYIAEYATPDNAILVWMDQPGLITDVRLIESDELVFETAPQSEILQGNAIVAVRDDDMILWSWHIWITPTTIFNADNKFANTMAIKTHATLGGGATYNIMKNTLGLCTGFTTNYGDAARSVQVRITQTGIENPGNATVTITQNQGAAVSVTGGDNHPFWQFGRKDPMPPGNGTGNVDKKLFYGPTNLTFTKTAGPVSLEMAILNPNVIYYNSGSNWNGGSFKNLWNANNIDLADPGTATVVKTIYDPSPVGFQMPNRFAWTGFTSTGTSQTISANWNINGTFNKGFTFYLGGWQTGATAFFPATGGRSNASGLVVNVGASGNYWSAAASTAIYGFGLNFDSTYVSPQNSYNRSAGLSVRCAAE